MVRGPLAVHRERRWLRWVKVFPVRCSSQEEQQEEQEQEEAGALRKQASVLLLSSDVGDYPIRLRDEAAGV